MLSRCSLVSFDCEFTGLRAGGIREDWEDTPDERYGKLRKVVGDRNYNVIYCAGALWALTVTVSVSLARF